MSLNSICCKALGSVCSRIWRAETQNHKYLLLSERQASRHAHFLQWAKPCVTLQCKKLSWGSFPVLASFSAKHCMFGTPCLNSQPLRGSPVPRHNSTSMSTVSNPIAAGPVPAAPSKPDAPPRVSYCGMFRYADWIDYVVLVLGVACAAVNGVALPAFSVLFGTLLDKITTPDGNFSSAVSTICSAFLIIGGGSFILSLGELTFLNISATRQIRRIRNLYYRAILRQNIGWFDLNNAGDLGSRLAEYVGLCLTPFLQASSVLFPLYTA